MLLLIAFKASQSEIVQVVRTAARIRRLMVNVIRAIERRLAIEAEKSSIPLNELWSDVAALGLSEHGRASHFCSRD